MNQILYTGKKEEIVETDLKRNTKQKSKFKRQFNKKKSMLYVGILATIGITTALSLSTNFNITSKAMTQKDIQIQEVQKNNTIDEQNLIAKDKEIVILNTVENSKEEKTEQTKPKKEEKSKNTKKTNNTTVKSTKSSSKQGYDIIAYLNIPSLNIKYSVLSSTSPELLKISLNKYWGANPNEVGNMCIVGHNYNDSRFFGNLNKIKKGAEVQITDMKGKTLTYKVYDTKMVDPYDTKCTSQLTNGKTEITLITCNYDGSQRFVVKARANGNI